MVQSISSISKPRRPGRQPGSGPTKGSWVKGQSGNPGGAPIQERTRIANKLIEAADQHRDALAEKVVQQALNGCTASQRLLFERLGPAPIRAQTAPGVLLGIAQGSIEQRLEAVLLAASKGDISSDEAKVLADTIRASTEAAAIASLEREIASIRDMRAQAMDALQTHQNGLQALESPQQVLNHE